jgi:DNA polymerase-3 subunit epsilon
VIVVPGPLADYDLVVVDIETTGWQPAEAAITEIGAVRLNGGEVTGEFSSLVRPGVPIPPDIITLTGITDAMVRRAPAMPAVLDSFLAFARGCVLVAHNAPFDLGFLTAACTASGLRWPGAATIDTAVLARLLLGPEDVPDCRLVTLADYFGAATIPAHRALADAKATADVLAGLLDLAASGRPPAARALPDRAALARLGRAQPGLSAGAMLILPEQLAS